MIWSQNRASLSAHSGTAIVGHCWTCLRNTIAYDTSIPTPYSSLSGGLGRSRHGSRGDASGRKNVGEDGQNPMVHSGVVRGSLDHHNVTGIRIHDRVYRTGYTGIQGIRTRHPCCTRYDLVTVGMLVPRWHAGSISAVVCHPCTLIKLFTRTPLRQTADGGRGTEIGGRKTEDGGRKTDRGRRT